MKLNWKNIHLLLLLLAFAQIGWAQTPVYTIEQVFAQQDGSALRPYLASEVELCIGENVDFITAAACIQQLNAWLKRHPKFQVEGQLWGSDNIKYYKGMLSQGGVRHKLIVYLHKRDSGEFSIDEIRISDPL